MSERSKYDTSPNPARGGQERSKYDRPAPVHTRPRRQTRLQSAVMGAYDGATFNLSDELAGGVVDMFARNPLAVANPAQFLAQAALNAFNPSKEGQRTRERVRGIQTRAREQNPLSYGAGAVVGGLATAPIGGGAIAGARDIAPRAAARVAAALPKSGLARSATVAAGAGAGYGALSGFGDAREGQRLPGAVTGGATGALVGGALPVIGRGVQAGLSNIAAPIARAIVRVPNRIAGGRLASNAATQREAEAMVTRAVLQSKLTPSQIRREVADWEKDGVIPSFLDVGGDSLRDLVRAATLRGSDARAVATQYQRRVTSSAPEAAANAAGRLSAVRGTRGQVVNALEVRTKEAQAAARADMPRDARQEILLEALPRLRNDTFRPAVNDARKTLQDNAQSGYSASAVDDNAELARVLRGDSYVEPRAVGMRGSELPFGDNARDAGLMFDQINGGAVDDVSGAYDAVNLIGKLRASGRGVGGIRDDGGDIRGMIEANRTRAPLQGMQAFNGVKPIIGLTSRNGRGIDEIARDMAISGELGDDLLVLGQEGLDAATTADLEGLARQRVMDWLERDIANAGNGRAAPRSREQSANDAYISQQADELGYNLNNSRSDAVNSGRVADYADSFNSTAGPRDSDYIPNEADLPPALSPDGFMTLNDRLNLAETNLRSQAAPDLTRAAQFTNLRNQIMEPVRDRFPSVNNILMAGESANRQKEALDVGGNAVSMLTPDFTDELARFNTTRTPRMNTPDNVSNENAMLEAGARMALQGRSMESIKLARSLANNTGLAERLRAVSPARAQSAIDAMRRVVQQVDNANYVGPMGKSPTAYLQNDAANWIEKVPLNALGFVRSILAGSSTMTDQEATAIVRLASQISDPAFIAQVNQRLEKAGRPLIEVPEFARAAMQRVGVSGAGATGAIAGGASGQMAQPSASYGPY